MRTGAMHAWKVGLLVKTHAHILALKNGTVRVALSKRYKLQGSAPSLACHATSALAGMAFEFSRRVQPIHRSDKHGDD